MEPICRHCGKGRLDHWGYNLTCDLRSTQTFAELDADYFPLTDTEVVAIISKRYDLDSLFREISGIKMSAMVHGNKRNIRE